MKKLLVTQNHLLIKSLTLLLIFSTIIILDGCAQAPKLQLKPVYVPLVKDQMCLEISYFEKENAWKETNRWQLADSKCNGVFGITPADWRYYQNWMADMQTFLEKQCHVKAQLGAPQHSTQEFPRVQNFPIPPVY